MGGSGWECTRVKGGDTLGYGGKRGQDRGLVSGFMFWENV